MPQPSPAIVLPLLQGREDLEDGVVQGCAATNVLEVQHVEVVPWQRLIVEVAVAGRLAVLRRPVGRAVDGAADSGDTGDTGIGWGCGKMNQNPAMCFLGVFRNKENNQYFHLFYLLLLIAVSPDKTALHHTESSTGVIHI